MVFGGQTESKIIQKSIEKVIEDKMHFRMAFWWLLVGFGVPFWGQGGSKMASRGSQDGLKSLIKKGGPRWAQEPLKKSPGHCFLVLAT